MGNTSGLSRIKKCIIITGMSGGGKSAALTVFEDQGYYAIDNLPPTLLPQLLEVLEDNQSAITNGVAAVVDVREEMLLNDLYSVVAQLRKRIEELKIIFMDASDETIVRRFETTRRRHPLAGNSTLLENIKAERELLEKIKAKADIVIETSELVPGGFKAKLLAEVGAKQADPVVILSSFGFKKGIPQDADYVADVRFLPNPNYIPELHDLTGKDTKIQEYLKKYEEYDTFIAKAAPLLSFVASVYKNTGKAHLHIAIGCTGGRHRSVAVCERLAEELKKDGRKVVINHRDINRESI